MYKIKLDTSTRFEKKVSLYKDKELLDEVFGDIDIVAEIANLLKKHKIDVNDINLVEPNKGPGSFTGLKIGVTVANVINWANKKKKIAELDYPDYGAEPNITLKKQ